jgi:hypothetical protein
MPPRQNVALARTSEGLDRVEDDTVPSSSDTESYSASQAQAPVVVGNANEIRGVAQNEAAGDASKTQSEPTSYGNPASTKKRGDAPRSTSSSSLNIILNPIEPTRLRLDHTPTLLYNTSAWTSVKVEEEGPLVQSPSAQSVNAPSIEEPDAPDAQIVSSPPKRKSSSPQPAASTQHFHVDEDAETEDEMTDMVRSTPVSAAISQEMKRTDSLQSQDTIPDRPDVASTEPAPRSLTPLKRKFTLESSPEAPLVQVSVSMEPAAQITVAPYVPRAIKKPKKGVSKKPKKKVVNGVKRLAKPKRSEKSQSIGFDEVTPIVICLMLGSRVVDTTVKYYPVRSLRIVYLVLRP